MAAADLLPDDVLEEILRRLAPSPRSLAACRVVCKAWRAAVDTRCPPPRPDLLPLSLAGIFFSGFYFAHEYLPGFFARRGHHHCDRIFPKLDYLDDAPISKLEAIDHCNGLLLMQEYIVNPATRRWARLPPTPEWSPAGSDLEAVVTDSCREEYLVFDPTVSPHYEVFSIPELVFCRGDDKDNAESVVRQHEWPPSPFVVQVYSSATGRWEKRSLVRRGEAAGTIADVHYSSWMASHHLYGVYWRGALHVQMKNNDVIRITLLDDKYQVIKSPSDINLNNHPYIYLGRSKKGVCCASIDDKQHQRLQVWLLHEVLLGGGQMEWMLIHDVSLEQIMADFRWNPEAVKPWIKHNTYRGENKNNEEISEDESPGWDSEDDSIVVYTEDMVYDWLWASCTWRRYMGRDDDGVL
ncbi:Os10g0381700 [Oryza sativa Japonica Group]|uniref:Os10g0381700 protein n=1 Tax=Oryza sativa subsp. japonica TaxID=39947 RepID=C7J7D5_ORYSJ|nr:Os10g0381700 [Oryza sativa Japonica Group]|eukprot:NP_001176130.1 Os10g0381700 [Oryza sativa Japonica Group]